jgi:hypothetical protein
VARSDVRAYVDEDLAHDVDCHGLLRGVYGVYVVVCAVFAQGISGGEYKSAEWVQPYDCPRIIAAGIVRWRF